MIHQDYWREKTVIYILLSDHTNYMESQDKYDNSRRVSATLDIIGRNAFDQALQLQVHEKYRLFHRMVASATSFSWIYTTAVTLDYYPVQLVDDSDIELRMRVLGMSAGTGKSIHVFDCELGQVLRSIESSTGSHTVVNSLSVSSPPTNSKLSPLLASGLHNGHVRIYDVMTGINLYERISETNHGAPISSVCIYEGDRSILLVGAAKKLHVWEFERCYRQAIITDQANDIASICICVRPRLTISSTIPSLIVSGDVLGYIYTHHLYTCKLLHSWKAHEGPIYSIISCVSIEYGYVISAGVDAVIRIWDSQTGELQRELVGHEGPINSIACVYGSNFPALVSGGHDTLIRIWNIFTGELLLTLPGHSGPIKTISSTSIPRFLIISGGLDNTTRIWDLDSSDDPQIHRLSRQIGIQPKMFKTSSGRKVETSSNSSSFSFKSSPQPA